MTNISKLVLLVIFLAGVCFPAFSQTIAEEVSDECTLLRTEIKCISIDLINLLDEEKIAQMLPNQVAVVINETSNDSRVCRKYEIYDCPNNVQEPQVNLNPIDTSQACPFIDEFGELRLCDFKDVSQQDFLTICHVQTNEGIQAFTCSSLTFNTLFTCSKRCLNDMCLIYLPSGERIIGDCSWFEYDILDGFTRKPVIDLSKEIVVVR